MVVASGLDAGYWRVLEYPHLPQARHCRAQPDHEFAGVELGVPWKVNPPRKQRTIGAFAGLALIDVKGFEAIFLKQVGIAAQHVECTLATRQVGAHQ